MIISNPSVSEVGGGYVAGQAGKVAFGRAIRKAETDILPVSRCHVLMVAWKARRATAATNRDLPMPKFKCPACRAVIDVPDAKLGKRLICYCGRRVRTPAARSSADTARPSGPAVAGETPLPMSPFMQARLESSIIQADKARSDTSTGAKEHDGTRNALGRFAFKMAIHTSALFLAFVLSGYDYASESAGGSPETCHTVIISLVAVLIVLPIMALAALLGIVGLVIGAVKQQEIWPCLLAIGIPLLITVMGHKVLRYVIMLNN